eukprot:1990018-Amphidinium_carterae.1
MYLYQWGEDTMGSEAVAPNFTSRDSKSVRPSIQSMACCLASEYEHTCTIGKNSNSWMPHVRTLCTFSLRGSIRSKNGVCRRSPHGIVPNKECEQWQISRGKKLAALQRVWIDAKGMDRSPCRQVYIRERQPVHLPFHSGGKGETSDAVRKAHLKAPKQLL